MPLSRGCVQRSVHGGASCEGKKEGEREGDLWQMRRVSFDGRLSPSTSIAPLLHGKDVWALSAMMILLLTSTFPNVMIDIYSVHKKLGRRCGIFTIRCAVTPLI